MILLETSYKSTPIILADEYPDSYGYKVKAVYLILSDTSTCNSYGSTCKHCPFQAGPGGSCSEAAHIYLKENFIHSHPELFL